jgi:hypothetical protein
MVKKMGSGSEENLPQPHEEMTTLDSHSREKTHPHFAGPQNAVTEPPASIRSEKHPVPKVPDEPVKNTEPTDFEKDLDILDSMNLEQIKGKIKDDCKTMVKHLRLDHLMDKD